MVAHGVSPGFVGSKGLSGGAVEEGKGWGCYTQLCLEPSNPPAGVSLRAQEVRKLPEEIILQEECGIKALCP